MINNLKFDVQVRRKDLWLKCHQYEGEPDESYRKRWEEAQGKSFYRAVLRHERSMKTLETAQFRSDEDETPHLRNLRECIDSVIRVRVCRAVHGPPPPCDQGCVGGYRSGVAPDGGVTVSICENPGCRDHLEKHLDSNLPKVELTVVGWPGEWEPLSIQKEA